MLRDAMKLLGIAGLLLCAWPAPSHAQQAAAGAPPAHEGADLAKKLANPISDLVSVPFQFNWEQNVGPHDDTRFILNVQPVMPFSLTEKLNLHAAARRTRCRSTT